MASEFIPESKAGANLVRLTRNRLDRVLTALTETPASTLPEAVHGARKDLKKLRALLRMARPALDDETFKRENHRLRDAGRALSAVRDSQVLAAVFDRLMEGHKAHVPSAAVIDSIRRFLLEDAQAIERTANLEHAAPVAAADLECLRARMEAWSLEEKGGWALLERGLEDTYHRGRQAMLLVWPPSKAREEQFHEWRKQVKYLMYQLRPLRPLWPRILKALTAELDELSELLGDEHDLAILGAKILNQPQPWAEPGDLEAIRERIEERRDALQRQALALGKRLYLEKSARFKRRLKGYRQAWNRKKEAHSQP